MKNFKIPRGTSFFHKELKHIPKASYVKDLEEMIERDHPDLPIYLRQDPRIRQFDAYANIIQDTFRPSHRLSPLEEELIERFYQWGKAFTYKPNINLIFRVFEDFGTIFFQLAIRCNTIDSRKDNQVVIIHVTNMPMDMFATMSFDFFTHWVYDQILKMERHEMDEFFKVKGVMIYDPHKNERQANE